MNCDCVMKVAGDLATHAEQKMKAENPRVSPDFLGINLSTGESTTNLTYTLRADNRPYNTGKGKTVNMVASYCPFCGMPTKRIDLPGGVKPPSYTELAESARILREQIQLPEGGPV